MTAALSTRNEPMIYLGNVRQAGASYIIRRAVATVKEQGRAAIFIGENGEAAAYSYLHPDYDRHLSRHHARLVGVYQNAPACDRVCCELVRAIEDDVGLHLAALGLAQQLEQAA